MSRTLRNESTDAAKKIWKAVDNAAAKAPTWLREKIEGAPISSEKRQTFLNINKQK